LSLLLAVVVTLLTVNPAAAAESSAACDRSVQQILRGNYDAALRQLNGAKTSGGAPAEVENLRGLALLLDGDTAKALVSFDKALALQPSLQPARFNRALAFLRKGDSAKAAADLEKVFADEHSALRADAAYHLGIAYDRMGRPAEAEAWLDRAIKLDEKLDAALLYVGMLRERRGDLQSAGRAYLDYLERYPQSPAALLRFGISAQKAGRIDVAKTYLQHVIDAAPKSPEAIEARKFLVMWE
jgi:tetratricopeptide (TPR) repeat protein